MSQCDLWLLIYGGEKAKSGCFKDSTSFVLQQCQNHGIFHRNVSGVVLAFSLNFQRVSCVVLS